MSVFHNFTRLPAGARQSGTGLAVEGNSPQRRYYPQNANQGWEKFFGFDHLRPVNELSTSKYALI